MSFQSLSARSLGLPAFLLAFLLVGASAPAQPLQLLGDDRPRLPGRTGAGMAAALVDLDGDGLQDLVRVTTTELDVLHQAPGGVFGRRQAPIAIAAGARPVSVAAGRLTGGALPDVVVGLMNSDSLLFGNDGSGGLLPVATTPFPRPGSFTGATTQVLVADLDGQPGDDVLILHDGTAPQLFAQTAAGLFQSPVSPAFALQQPQAALADLDGDQQLEAVLVQRGTGGPPLVARFLRGGFTVSASAFPGWTPSSLGLVRLADVVGGPAPDVLLGPAVAGRVRVFENLAGTFTERAVAGWASPALIDMAIADLDGDRVPEVLALSAAGELLEVQQRSGAFQPQMLAVGTAVRASLELADLEGDGDLDAHVLGVEVEDQLWLNDGAGRLLDSESVAMPTGGLPRGAAFALLDLSGEGDPEIVGYRGAGEPVVLANDGAARFTPAAGLPRLSGWQVAALEPASIGSTSGRDLVVLGTAAGSLVPAVRLLVQSGTGLVDETAARWPNTAAAPRRIAVGDLVLGAKHTGWSDVVATDAAGRVNLFVNTGGQLAASMPVAGIYTAPDATRLLLGDVDGDRRLDVVVLRSASSPDVLLTSGSLLVRVAQSLPGAYAATDGALADVTGDGVLDLLLLRSNSAATGLALLEGRGDGSFFDQSSLLAATLSGVFDSVAVLPVRGGREPPALVLGSAVGRDVVLRWTGAAYGVALPIPDRGSRATEQLLVGDLDVDGDADLVVARTGFLPRVLLQQSLQLAQLGVGQLGRPTALRLSAPGPGAAVFFTAVAAARLPLSGFGLLRLGLTGLTQIGAIPVPGDLTFRTSTWWAEVRLPIQAAWVDLAGNPTLSNLEWLELIR